MILSSCGLRGMRTSHWLWPDQDQPRAARRPTLLFWSSIQVFLAVSRPFQRHYLQQRWSERRIAKHSLVSFNLRDLQRSPRVKFPNLTQRRWAVCRFYPSYCWIW